MEQTTGGYEMIPGYLCLHYSSITVHYCVYSCFKFVFFSGNKVCVQVVWWKKHDSDRAFFYIRVRCDVYTRMSMYIYIYISINLYLYIYIFVSISIHLYIYTRILSLVLGIVYIVFVWIGCMMLTSYFQASSQYRAAKETSWDPQHRNQIGGCWPVSGFGRLKIAMGMFNLDLNIRIFYYLNTMDCNPLQYCIII